MHIASPLNWRAACAVTRAYAKASSHHNFECPTVAGSCRSRNLLNTRRGRRRAFAPWAPRCRRARRSAASSRRGRGSSSSTAAAGFARPPSPSGPCILLTRMHGGRRGSGRGAQSGWRPGRRAAVRYESPSARGLVAAGRRLVRVHEGLAASRSTRNGASWAAS